LKQKFESTFQHTINKNLNLIINLIQAMVFWNLMPCSDVVGY